MDRGTWKAPVHRVTRVWHEWATKERGRWINSMSCNQLDVGRVPLPLMYSYVHFPSWGSCLLSDAAPRSVQFKGIPTTFPTKLTKDACCPSSQSPEHRLIPVAMAPAYSGVELCVKTHGEMLERVWIKGNPLTLLVGMQTSTAAMENSVEIP